MPGLFLLLQVVLYITDTTINATTTTTIYDKHHLHPILVPSGTPSGRRPRCARRLQGLQKKQSPAGRFPPLPQPGY
ncbi:hypothetical protein FPSE_11723 [Fusarium pseudograminearum CS3096]|uniref:Secreted protein n=1 Tax=Fusarium pseudograminearum (strain CS3096) TaxID=1028729 RepID=K3V8A1_FUSPC|nr:hypothetical protein FPSE_11723 [Fusarium pseudograminearum CS3096]EKJ68123.1 hypothetical protein FPSE_11723 [Fusarium pseudograminearum CS3096]